MRFMQIESVLQTINRSEPAKNRFSVALVHSVNTQWLRRYYVIFFSAVCFTYEPCRENICLYHM